MILIGTKCRLEQTVTDALTAANVGSGALPVFGTPYMSVSYTHLTLPTT